MDKRKRKIISNQNKEYISNILGAIFSFTEKNYLHPIKPSDLEIIVTYTSKSRNRNLPCKIEIINSSFDAERDLNKVKNIDIENKFEFSIKKIQSHQLNLSVKLKKNQQFQPNNFSFYIKDNEIKEFKFPKNDKYVIFFYSSKLDYQILNSINNSLNFIQINNELPEQFEKIYYIVLINKLDEIDNLYNKVNQSINYFKVNPEKYKLIFLKNNTEENKPVNIFNNDNLYFFIINSNQKIITVKHLTSFQKKIKKILNGDNKKIKPDYSYLFSELYSFFNNIKNLPYLFSFDSSYSIKLKINDDFSTIEPLKLMNFIASGELRTKEYKFLKNIIEELQYNSTLNSLKEIETIDFDVPLENAICSNCQKIIENNEPLYICGWCRIHFCINCTEERLKLNLNLMLYRNNLIHQEHNLIYITSKNPEQIKNIDSKKIGRNLFHSANQEQLSFDHKAICNGCRKNFERLNCKVRYLCLNCRPGKTIFGGYADYCYECINLMRTNEQKRKQIEDIIILENNEFDEDLKNIPQYHSHLQHAYLTIPIAVNGDNYYEF